MARRHYFSLVLPTSASYNLFYPIFYDGPSALEGAVMVPLVTEHSNQLLASVL